MPPGVYIHKPHSETTKKKISKSLQGQNKGNQAWTFRGRPKEERQLKVTRQKPKTYADYLKDYWKQKTAHL